MATTQNSSEPTPEPSRRAVLRGAVAFGLIGAVGLPLSACGNDSTNAADAAPSPEAGAPAPQPAGKIRPGGTSPPTGGRPQGKGDTYSRGPEQRPARTAAPEAPAATPAADAPAGTPAATPVGEPVGSRSGDLATARERDKKNSGRPTVAATAAPFARTSDIPVGGGKAFRAQNIVVTQPKAGQYIGFSGTCTHAGCFLDKVDHGQIVCPCHGCEFSIVDGAVSAGPASVALPTRAIAVDAAGNISAG